MNVCIFTVVKDEQAYLDDWLKYHRDMLIDIYVFEDVFSTSHKKITDKYDNVYLHSILDMYNDDEKDKIIQMRKDDVAPQTEYINKGLAYIHSLQKYDWCALIDIDEFITCTEKFPDILERYKEHQAVLIYWRNFNCSGHLYKPIYDKPIWEIYTDIGKYEQYSDYKHFKITKFIVNMSKWKPEHKYFIHCANVDFIKADMSYTRTEIVYEPLYLRHYVLKSCEEYLHKVYVRGCFHTNHRNLQSLKEMDAEIYERLKNEKGFREYFKNKYNVELPPFD